MGALSLLVFKLWSMLKFLFTQLTPTQMLLTLTIRTYLSQLPKEYIIVSPSPIVGNSLISIYTNLQWFLLPKVNLAKIVRSFLSESTVNKLSSSGRITWSTTIEPAGQHDREVIRSMCTKFDGPNWNGSVCVMFTRFNNNVYCVTLTFDPWPWTSIDAVMI